MFLSLLFGFPLLAAQDFSRVSLPASKPLGIQRDDSLPPMYPSASSGISRGGGSRPFHGMGHQEVDSLDLQPNPSILQPEFRVVQPPDFGLPRQPVAPMMPVVVAPPPPHQPQPQPQPTYPDPDPEPEAEVPVAPAVPEVKGPEVPNNAYEINFCDHREFPDDVLSTYGLERVDYFIWNATCSSIFFQCSIGHTFLLRCTSDDQAFDRSTTNCNFKNAVKICPEYDHVMHCTIRESCSPMEYACCSQPQQCLPLSRRCDGHADCADGDDENNCPSCKRDEFACVQSGRCISADQRCDGKEDDCGDGTNLDEIGCDKNSTCVGKFMCGQSRVGASCIDWTHHCDGNKDCYHGEDEVNCRQGGEAKYLLCENQKQSVTKNQWCDGQKDCADSSDEKYCY